MEMEGSRGNKKYSANYHPKSALKGSTNKYWRDSTIGTVDSSQRLNTNGALLNSSPIDQFASRRLIGVGQGKMKKSYERLADVYSNSGDTVEFAQNFEKYLNNVIPPQAWIVLLSILGIWSLILILTGSFNFPFCAVEPMIPIYLIVSGCLFLLFAAIRIYNFWPLPEESRRPSLGVELACRVVEAAVCVAIMIWLVLGSIWTYGARQYVHFEEEMFQRHYCDSVTYWVAFMSVTLHISFVGIAMAMFIIIIAFGIWKETDVGSLP